MNKTPEEIYDDYKLGELPIIKSAVIHAMEAYASQFESAGLREALEKHLKENDVQFKMRVDKYNYALKCGCDRCKEIVSSYAAPAASKEERGKEERTFTLKEALEIWKAGHLHGDQNCEFGGNSLTPNKKQYFKETFNIGIEKEEGK